MERESVIIVGKHILESLTVGMYANSKIIFREYVQNAADAIDEAVAKGVLSKREEGKIDITIDKDQREIRIRDNGIGISSENVGPSLCDIGNSQKSHVDNRGFRGIGRLGGLGYCEKLQFITSYKGESCKTIITWDCTELKRLLRPDVARDMILTDVIKKVTSETSEAEEAEEHYFEVILEGINGDYNELLNSDIIKDYLSQVAPVPFDEENCALLKKINEELKRLGKEPEEFTLFLNGQRILKPYKSKIRAGQPKKGKKENFDELKRVKFFYSYKEDKTLLFFGWYSQTDLSGMIKDDNISGLRLRKRNILIGNNRTLDEFFGDKTNQRFNRYFVGEVYVFDVNLIPNARRDHFEENGDYEIFKKEVETTTKHKLAKLPHKATKARKAKEAKEELDDLFDEEEQPTASSELVVQPQTPILPEQKPTVPLQAEQKPITPPDSPQSPILTEQKPSITSEPPPQQESVATFAIPPEQTPPEPEIDLGEFKEVIEDVVFEVIDRVGTDKKWIEQLKNQIAKNVSVFLKHGKRR